MQVIEQSTLSQEPGFRQQDQGRREKKRSLGSLLGRGVAVWLGTPRFSVVGVIDDIRPHALSILVKRRLAEGSVVTVEFGAVSREGEVASCVFNGHLFEASIVFPNRGTLDARTAERFPVTTDILLGADSLESQRKAVVRDLSVCGVGLEIEVPLKIGETIVLETPADIAVGVVRHCTPSESGGFHAGAEIFHLMPKETAEQEED